MAKFEFDLGPVQKMLEELGDIDEVAPRMLRRVGPIAKAAIQGRLKKHSRTGGLVKSVRPGKPKTGKTGGWYMIVGFRGYDKNGHPNDVKAAGLEYGNSHQQPEPFLDAAAKDCEAEVVDAMQAEYNLWLKEKGMVK
ncbi:MAG: hypothetical protein HFF14_05740 [Angelakisella sp.]|jgi:HK97 gp10 family phage protein|nr:hypothetical protein [Angelakisella sp.]